MRTNPFWIMDVGGIAPPEAEYQLQETLHNNDYGHQVR